MSEGAKLWGGRFKSTVDERIHAFTKALAFDRRLAPYDLLGSLAHARMLWESGILDEGTAAPILDGLGAMLAEVESGALVVDGEDEDVHSWIERLLGERIGAAARSLHTARSRNDQTGIALRLYVRSALAHLVAATVALQEHWIEVAAEHTETFLPGYTHLQRGQPVSLAHHLLAHVWALQADVERFWAARDRSGRSPLGAGALAGSPYPLRPLRTAELLGMPSVYRNSMWAVADRDYVVEAAAACALLLVHLSRWADEVVLWTSSEFGFARLEDRVAKGSSLMPQKKNPEAAEILRGKSARVIGDLTALLTLLKGLPLTYNSDLQEDKEALFDALDTAALCLGGATALSEGLRYDRDRMERALAGGFVTATDLADHLVGRGVPFRSAHEEAGAAVQLAESRGVELWELGLEDLRSCCPRCGDEVASLLSPQSSVRRRRELGGPAPEAVREQIAAAGRAVEASRARLAERRTLPIEQMAREGRLHER